MDFDFYKQCLFTWSSFILQMFHVSLLELTQMGDLLRSPFTEGTLPSQFVLVFNILWLNASLFWLIQDWREEEIWLAYAITVQAWHLLFGDSHFLAVSWWPWTSIRSISNSSCCSSTHKTFISVLSDTHVEAYISQATASSSLKPHCHCKHKSVQGKLWERTKPPMADVRQMLIHLEVSG